MKTLLKSAKELTGTGLASALVETITPIVPPPTSRAVLVPVHSPCPASTVGAGAIVAATVDHSHSIVVRLTAGLTLK